MKIDVNRLCKLAGLNNNSRSGLMKESAHDVGHVEEMDAMHEEEIEEGAYSHNEADDVDEADEMIEIDEVMLVQELRRAKRLMQEANKRKRNKMLRESKKARRQEKLAENEIKQIIESEVANVMKDLNLTGGWMYGNKKPKRSKKGYSHQGSYLKGIGFE